MKRVNNYILSGILAFGIIFQIPNNFVAAENLKESDSVIISNEVFQDLQNNYDEDSVLCAKLEYDQSRHTTDLDADLEEQLNSVGVFDSEIEKLDDDTLQLLEDSINTSVYVSYISVDEESGDMEEMSKDEVDAVIEEMVEQGKMEIEESTEISAVSKLFSRLGFLPEVVHAKEINKKSAEDISSSGAVKQTIYACQTKSGGSITCTATAVWLKEANYRNKDVFGVWIEGASMSSSSSSCTHSADFNTIDSKTGKCTVKHKSSNPTTHYYSTNGIAFVVDLFGDRSTMGPYDQYTQETISIKFTCTAKKGNKVTIVPYYLHAQTSISISPNVSISSGGISVGISGSAINYYKQITNNPLLEYTVK